MKNTTRRSQHPHPSGSGTPEPTTPATEEPRSWSVLAVALAAQLLVVLDISVVNTALPSIGEALSLSGSQLQWVVTAYLLFSGGGLLLGGRVSDLLPRRLVFLAGLAVFTTASLASGLATDGGMLIASRAGQGLGAAAMTPAALSLILTTYAGAQRTKGLALWGALGSMGVAAGVVFGGALTTWAGWQMIFWINVPVGVAAFVAGRICIPKEPTTAGGLRELDLPGALVAVAGLAVLLLAIQGGADHGWLTARTVTLAGLALVLFGAFPHVERRVRRPLVPPHTWKVATLVSGTTVMFCVTGVLVGTIFLTSVFVQTVLGYSALTTGLSVLPLALVMTLSTHAASHLLSRYAPRVVAAAGLVTAAAGALALSRATAGSSYVTGVLPGLVVLGLGAGLVFVAVSVSAMAGIPAQHAGMASGFLMTGHEVGAAVGVAVVSAVATTAGSLATASGAAAGFSRGLIAVAVICIASAGVSFATMAKARLAGGAAMHMHH